MAIAYLNINLACGTIVAIDVTTHALSVKHAFGSNLQTSKSVVSCKYLAPSGEGIEILNRIIRNDTLKRKVETALSHYTVTDESCFKDTPLTLEVSLVKNRWLIRK